MLIELYIRNLAVIEEMRLEFTSGLTVLSGEEGSGKSLIVDALCLLMGGKSSSTLVRGGAPAAIIEGIFWTAPCDSELRTKLEGAGIAPDDDGTLILSREVREHGRGVARVNGRAVPVSLFQELGQLLMDVHSQMEHISLLNPRRQLDILDGFGGLLQRRAQLGGRIGELREKTRELSALGDKNAERRRELLEYQVAEITGAEINPGEDDALEQERQMLRRVQMLNEECYRAYHALYADDPSATGILHQAADSLREIVAIDPALNCYLESLDAAAAELEETARDLRHYAEAVESRASELEQVEARLEQLRHLKSKYGPGLDEVLDFADRAREELESLALQEDRKRCLEKELRVIEKEAGELAEELSAAREETARSLAQLVNSELSDLDMVWARFDVSFSREERCDGLPTTRGRYTCSQNGIDLVEFSGATNPGEPLRPLSDIASGGETCRYMLAMKGALRKADLVSTLVFDEIDAGIGGRNANIIGRKLATLAQDRQVLCITHLPQIACFGRSHYRVVKEVSTGRAITRVEHLEGDSRLRELAAMLGSCEDGPMLETAKELLKCVTSSEKECVTIGV